ncbi:MAG: glycosyltransferase, partial [Planctomycetes bacterium]|nr:glycosyltransferase [Planctomycetota bacterium]
MARVIRSLHIDTERTWRGGEQQALYLAAGLVRRGHVAEVAGNPGSEYLRRARALGLAAHEVPMRTDFDPAAFRRLRRLLVEGRFDVVHGHTSRGHVMAGTAALWLRSCRVIVTRRVDFSIRRPPLHPGRLKYRHGIDRFIAISEAVRAVLLDGGVKPARIAVVPSGIDMERLAAADAQAVRAEFGLGNGAPLIGAVAHFAWHKGLEHLVDAIPLVLQKHPQARFFLVGDGELAGELKERAARVAPPGTVFFPGFRLDAPYFLQASDLVATPSVMEALNTTN